MDEALASTRTSDGSFQRSNVAAPRNNRSSLVVVASRSCVARVSLVHGLLLRIETRWPVIFAVFAVALLLTFLPDRIRVLPVWAPFVLGIVLIMPMAAVMLSRAKERWLSIERTMTLLFVVAVGSGMIADLALLIVEMVRRSGEVSGIQLLASSVGMWVLNVLTFSLLFWQIDRGGPEARSNTASPMPDWLFPQEGVPQDVPPGWRPTFVDYLFLGFSTATAFSTTDVMPLTSRAKMLMMLESTISLATIVAVMSRAINILGS
jgi:hypothetical protein